MAAQPHIPYAILPKRFEPKQVSNNGPQQQLRSSNSNTNNKNSNRYHRPAAPHRSQRQQAYYDDQWNNQVDDSWRQSNVHRRFNREPNQQYRPTNGLRGPHVIINFEKKTARHTYFFL